MVSDGMLNALAQAASDEIASARVWIGGTSHNETISAKTVNDNRVDVTITITSGGSTDVITKIELLDGNANAVAVKEDSVGRTEAASILYLFMVSVNNPEEE